MDKEDNSAASSDAPCDNEGCLWRGPKQDKRSHLAKCPLASVSCPNANAGCGRAGVRQVIEEHLKNGCEFAGRRVEDEMYRTIQPGIPESVSPTTEQIDDDDEKQTKIQRFNFMVAGGAGLGKTTFLPTFFEVFGKPDDQNSLNNVTKIKASLAKNESTREIKRFYTGDYTFPGRGNNERQVVRVTIYDTPGWGHLEHTEDSYAPVVAKIKSLFKKYREFEHGYHPLDVIKMDPCIHACFYFIAPHRLTEVDMLYMRAIHEYVNVIPVIAKSDSMTIQEATDFEAHIIEALESGKVPLSIKSNRANKKKGHDSSAASKGKSDSAPQKVDSAPQVPSEDVVKYFHHENFGARRIFRVMGCNPDSGELGVRDYGWGKAEVNNGIYFDMQKLRTVIQEQTVFEALQRATHNKYQSHRDDKNKASSLSDKQKFEMLRLGLIVLIAAILVIGVAVFFWVGSSLNEELARNERLEKALALAKLEVEQFTNDKTIPLLRLDLEQALANLNHTQTQLDQAHNDLASLKNHSYVMEEKAIKAEVLKLDLEIAREANASCSQLLENWVNSKDANNSDCKKSLVECEVKLSGANNQLNNLNASLTTTNAKLVLCNDESNVQKGESERSAETHRNELEKYGFTINFLTAAVVTLISLILFVGSYARKQSAAQGRTGEKKN